jgi:hypothetical protein
MSELKIYLRATLCLTFMHLMDLSGGHDKIPAKVEENMDNRRSSMKSIKSNPKFNKRSKFTRRAIDYNGVIN